MEIIAADATHAYYSAVQVALAGTPRSPRGRKTYDAGFVSIFLETPVGGLPQNNGRRPLTSIAAGEALQLIAGVANAGLMTRISPKFHEFIEDGTFFGAYGARVKMQVVAAANKLHEDLNTRQAIVTLWDAHLDNLPGHKDYPCTVALQFQVREDTQLCMNVFMRSSDVWLGLPYDIFQFTQLQCSLAHSLGLEFGWYRHTTLSLHAYDDDVENLRNVQPATNDHATLVPSGVGRRGEPFTEIMKRARRLMTGLPVDDMTKSEEWYEVRMRPYVGRTS